MKTEKYIILITLIFLTFLTLLFVFSTKTIRQKYNVTLKRLDAISKIVKIYNLNLKLKSLRGLNQLNKKYEIQLKKELHIDNYDIFEMLKSLNLNNKRIINIYMDIYKHKNKLSKYQLFILYTKIIKLLKFKIMDIASKSDLFSYSDEELYYLMALFINYIPDIVENVGQIRGIGTGLISSNLNDKNKLKILLQLNIENFEEKIINIRYCISKLNPTLQEDLNEHLQNILTSFYELKKIVNTIIEDSYSISAPEYFLKTSLIINKINFLYIAVKNFVVNKIEKRKQILYYKIAIATLIYLLSVIFTIFIFFFYYRKIKKDNQKKIIEKKTTNIN